MEKTRKWRKILAMMLTVVMMLQNAQSVMVFADVTNEQIEQRLAGNQGQTEETQPAQSQVDTRANGEEYKTQLQETQENGNGSTDIGSPESGNATTEAKTSNADVSATITQSVFQADVSGTTCNFVQMTAQITNNDTENPATGVSVKALLNSAQLSWVNGYGTETAGAGAYAVDSNNTADLPDGSADGYDQIVMWTDQTIGAGETVAYQFAAQIIPENLDGVVNAWYINGNSCSYTWENTEILVPTQAPVESTPEVAPPQTEPEEKPEVKPEETTPEETTPEETTPEDKKAIVAKKKQQQKLLAQRNMEDESDTQDGEDESGQPTTGNEDSNQTVDRTNIGATGNTVDITYEVNGNVVDLDSYVLNRNDILRIRMSYKFADNNKPSQTDRVRYYQLDASGWNFLGDMSGKIKDETDNYEYGDYTINPDTGMITFTYNDTFLNQDLDNIRGTFRMDLRVDKKEVADSDTIKIKFPGKPEITVHLNRSEVTGNKDFEKDEKGKLVVDENGYLTYYIHLKPEYANANNLVVTDTITGQFEFVNGSFKLDGAPIALDNITIENDGKKATITIGTLDYSAGEKVLSYKVKPKSGITDYSITNEAGWSWTGGSSTGGEGHGSTTNVQDKIVKKVGDSATYAADDKISYTIEINKLKADLIPEGKNQKVILTDKIDTSKLRFIQNSVKIYTDMSKTQELTSATWKYSSETETLEVEVPDETYAVVVYEVKVKGNKNDKVSITNTAELQGETTITSEDSTDFVVSGSASTVTGDTGTVTILKVGTYSKSPLSDVEFKIYKVTNLSSATKESEFSVEELDSNVVKKTDSGKLVFGKSGTKLKADTLYYFVETKTLDRYILNERKRYFVINPSETTSNILNNILKIKFEVASDGGVLDTITNDEIPNPISDTVIASKYLDGNAPANNTFEFELKLKKYEPHKGGYQPASEDPKPSYDSVIGNSGSNITFAPINFLYEGDYTFEVTEKIGRSDQYFYDTNSYQIVYGIGRNSAGNLEIKSKEIKRNNEKKDLKDPIRFDNYTATSLTVTKSVDNENGANQATTFEIQLTGTWNKEPLDFSSAKCEGMKLSSDHKTATVLVTVGQWSKSSKVEIKGLPKGARIFANEVSNKKGWTFINSNPKDGIVLSETAADNNITVTNHYEENGSVVFSVQKKYNDWRNTNNKKFTFQINAISTTANVGSIPMPLQDSVSISCNASADSTKTVSFDPVNYTENGDYYYKISEVIDPNATSSNAYTVNGITYDPKVTYVKVSVKDGRDGAKDIQVFTSEPVSADTKEDDVTYTESEDGNAIAKFENSYHAETTVQFVGTKEIKYKNNWNGEKFKFYINGPKLNKDTVVENVNSVITFPEILYTVDDLNHKKEETFTYTITEDQTKRTDGIQADSRTYTVVVKVTNNEDGTLTAVVENATKREDNTYKLDGTTFENVYGATENVVFTASKKLEGKSLTGETFNFELADEGNTTFTAVNDSEGNIVFDQINYSVEQLTDTNNQKQKYKEFNYTIREVPDNNKRAEGIVFDETVYRVKVTVTDVGNGKLLKTVTDENEHPLSTDKNGYYILPKDSKKAANFVNKYEAETTVQFKGTKELVNKELKAGAYTFTIKAKDAADQRFTNDKNELTSTKSVTNEAPAAGNSNIGEIVFPVMRYTIADLDGETVKNGVRTKDFNYIISETKPENQVPGITYDETGIEVTVRLTDDGKGNLSTQVLYNGTGDFKNPDNGIYTLPTPQNKNATFTNTYDSSTEIQIKGTKVLVNQELKENRFKFKIESVDQQKDNRFAGNKTEEIQTNKAPGENNVGEFEFGVMKYTAADLNDVQADKDGVREKSFHYKISEVDGGLTKGDGIKYDGREIWVTVKLTDDGKSNLKAELSIKNSAEGNAHELTGSENNGVMVYTLPALTDKSATFTNIFVKKSLELKALKKLVGRNFKDGDEFMFIVTKDGHQFDSKTITPTSGNEVEFTFKADEYTLADVGKTYHYSIREDHGNKITGVTNSNRVYEVFVTPTYDEANGTILFQKVEKITERDENGKEVEKDINFETAEFTNVYEADGTAQIVAEKNLSPLKIKDGEFSFTLTQVNEDGTELTGGYTQKSVTNVGSSVIFKPISYTAADIGKTYYYTVKEDKPDEIPKGYEYSNDVYRVTITIGEAEGKDNKLTVTKQIAKEGSEDPVDTIVFYNTYKATGSIELTGKKEVKDFTGELKDGAFNFIVTENGEKVATGKNDKDGKITFDKIQYVYDGSNSNVLGKHTYTISEVQPETGDSYIYDKTTRKVVVEVKDKGDGTLDASIVTGADETTNKDISDVDIDAENNIVVKKFVNEEMGISFRKTDIADKEIEGATLTLYEYKDGKKGAEVTHWETKKDETHVVTSGLVAGNSYILEETKVPDGYVKADPIVFKINNDAERSVEIVSGGQKDKNGNIVMVDKKTGVQILKVNEDGKPLAGASLAIKDSTGNIIDQWVSTDAAHTIEGKLVEGAEYVLTEIKAPEGYKMASDVTFKANASDKPTVVTMKDDYTEVSIQKTDYNGKAISGATLELKDSTGKVIDTWKTDGTAHVLKGKLVEGAEYTLTETSAPSGYRVSLDIKFKVSKNEKVTTVTMKDAPTKASILKTDESGKALSGAQLVVKDSTGKEIDKWTTDGKAHEITGLLTVGETYTLSEVSAPSGYTVAPDQTFKMEDKDVIEVTMVDYQASGSGQITVTKKVTLLNGGSTEELIAADDTFYVNLFTDAAGKYPYKGAMPQAIHLVNASAGSVTFSDLAQGTYYVYETDANGNVVNLDQLSLHNGSQFMCIVDGDSNVVQLDLKAGPKEGFVNLENAFYELPDGYYYKGEININKQVLKGDSQTTTNDTFYAGVFTKDEQGIYNLYQVVELVQNDTVTLEVPLGGEDGTEPINYYILETDADGNILDLDVFEYEVTGEGTVTLSKENQTGNINLVNRIPEETDGKLRVQKTDGNGVGLAGASFRLTDSEGAVIEEWTSQASAHELELEPGTYTLTEIQAPTGYTGAGSLKITVDEDYNFSVSGEIEYSYKDGLLKIVNKVVPATPQPGTPVSGGTGAVSYSSALSGKVAVKTGDTTPVGWFLGLFATAAMLAGAAVHLKRRKR